MADIEALSRALKNADAAGDVDAATKLAAALSRATAAPAPKLQLDPAEYDPSSPEFQAKHTAADPRGLENFRAGVGKGMTDVARGIKQASPVLFEPFGMVRAGYRAITGQKSERDIQNRKDFDEVKRRDAALLSTKAGLGGNITGAVASALPAMFVPGANTYAGSTVIGAGLGALQPVGTDDSRAVNTTLGAAGGAVGKYVGSKIGNWANRVRGGMSAEAQAAEAAARSAAAAEVTGGAAGATSTITGKVSGRATGGGSGFGSVGDDVSAALTQRQKELLTRGQEIGFEFTPGVATGSKALQQFEAKLSSQPMTSGPFFAKAATNQTALNREVAASIGESSKVVDDVVLGRASERLGRVFESAKDDIARPIDPQKFVGLYSEIAEDLRGVSKGFNGHPLVDDLVRLAEQGTATGKQLQPLTSKLGKAAYKEMSSPQGDRELGLALYKVKDYVDDILQSGMDAERQQVFGAARGQYRNLINLLSRTNVVNPSSGNVNGRALAQMLQQRDRGGFTLGRNQTGMYDAARVSQAFPPIVGDSGTATRSMVTNPLELLMSAPFNLASRAYVSAPSVRLATGAQAVARPAAQMSDSLARALLENPARRAPYFLPGSAAAAASELPGYE